jgi:hypothetical protein
MTMGFGALRPAITRGLAGSEQFAGLQQLAIQERVRHATEGGERYVPSAGRPEEGFALQADQDSYDFGTRAKTTIAPAWRNEVAILDLAPTKRHGARPSGSLSIGEGQPAVSAIPLQTSFPELLSLFNQYHQKYGGGQGRQPAP